MGDAEETTRFPRIQYVVDLQEAERVAQHCLRLGDYDRYVNVPAERVRALFSGPHAAYAKVFHAVYQDVESPGARGAWTDSDQHVAWWRRTYGTDPPDPLPRGVWEIGAPDRGRRLLWRDQQGPLQATTDAFTHPRERWPRHLVVPEHLDPVSLDALVSVIAERYGSEDDTWMFRRQGVVPALELQLAGRLDVDGVPPDWVLARGPIGSVRQFVADTGLPPDWWWAAESTWEVFSDDESQVTFVGGPAALVAALLEHPDLEAIAVEGDARAYVHTDRRTDAR